VTTRDDDGPDPEERHVLAKLPKDWADMSEEERDQFCAQVAHHVHGMTERDGD
jgi:hypothetical protein